MLRIPPRQAGLNQNPPCSDFGAAVVTTAAIATGVTGVTAAGAAAAGTARIETIAGSITTTAIFPAAGAGAIAAAFAAGTGVTAAATAVTTSTTTAAIAAAAAIATTAGSATAAATTATAGLSLVDAKGTPHQLDTLQGIDGLGFQFGIGHLHEGETTLATRIPLKG